MTATVGVITNPNSKKNWRFPERRGAIQRAVGSHGIVRETRNLEELPIAVSELLDAGVKYWVCDGGDGTLHWVLNTLHTTLRERDGDDLELPVIVPTNGGTVDFIARKAGLKGDAVSIVERLCRGLDEGRDPGTVRIDTCRHIGVGTSEEGAPIRFDRLGLATAVAGVANNFFDKYYQLPKDRGALAIAGVIGAAAAAGLLGTVAAPFRRWLPSDGYGDFFRPTHAEIEVDGRRLGFTDFMSLQIGAIDINLAGVVRAFRHAGEDGVLHFQAISTTPVGVVFNVPNIVFGTPIRGRQVFDDKAREVTIKATNGERLNPVIDGEQFYGLDKLGLSLGPSLRIATLPAA
ncbi:MAG: hypothetical protein H6710_05155 [Myxococcales bacterium]|nr:hypothetical protein [Myxococcales bacterium]MCB9705560.1 hypothetical protein [Myxococcales bacterium]